jgi:hypothetical protein
LTRSSTPSPVTSNTDGKSERATDTPRPDNRDLHLSTNTSTAKMLALSDHCAHSPNVAVSR